jgi:hypothetical protein
MFYKLGQVGSGRDRSVLVESDEKRLLPVTSRNPATYSNSAAALPIALEGALKLKETEGTPRAQRPPKASRR